MKVTIYTDGASRGNPGHAGAGAVITGKDDKILSEVCVYLGETTNNQAEYKALILALERAGEIGASIVDVYCDSELMVKQIKGEYKVKKDTLKPLFRQAKSLFSTFAGHSITHVTRDKNKRADKLANLAIDGQFL